MAHDFKLFPELTNKQMQLYYLDSPHAQITQDFRARVVKVTDGDTVRVEVDFRDFDFPVRFVNTASPELDEEGGEKSQSWLEEQIGGEEVDVLINPKNRVGKWGRLLGEIIHRGLNINKLSVMLGYSINWRDRKQVRL